MMSDKINRFVKYSKVIITSMIMILFFTNYNAEAAMNGAPVPSAPCPDGSVNMVSGYIVCGTTQEADATGIMLVGAGAKYEVGAVDNYVGQFSGSYVPYTGYYTDRMHLCQTDVKGRCLLSKSTDYIDGANKQYYSSMIDIGSQGALIEGPAISKTISYSFSFCQTLVDSEGVEWASSDPTSCSDAHRLPTVPADCYINGGSSLDVNLGEMERSKISVAPNDKNIFSVTKNISILCVRDAGVNVKTKFEYTPINIDGGKFVATGLNGIGVAIYYDNKLISNNDELQDENYKTGYSYVNITFSPVRDKSIALKDTGTGEFTASVVMIMTEQ